ncbi:MAG: hypothetical protein ACE5OS_14185 [Anaerolineae bacterium]
MEGLELFPDEGEEEAAAEEGANRTFIILVGALGGLLALGICAFVAWALFINPQMRASIEATNAAVLAAAEATTEVPPATTEAPPESTEMPGPTDTSRPAQTEAPTTTEAPETPAATPKEATEAPTATATPEEVAGEATATPRPTATRRPTATPRSGNDEVPGTGIGVLGASALAAGLLFLLAVVRRMRRAA